MPSARRAPRTVEPSSATGPTRHATRPTPRTRLFDDYTDGSYHIDKLDLLEGVREIRKKERVVGLAVSGPSGPLWTYCVVLVLKDPRGYRLNSVVMPHARITGKGTRTISRTEYERARRTLTRLPEMASGLPTPGSVGEGRASDVPLEWRYEFLLADWSDASENVWHSKGVLEPEPGGIVDVLDGLLKDITPTYPVTGIE